MGMPRSLGGRAMADGGPSEQDKNAEICIRADHTVMRIGADAQASLAAYCGVLIRPGTRLPLVISRWIDEVDATPKKRRIPAPLIFARNLLIISMSEGEQPRRLLVEERAQTSSLPIRLGPAGSVHLLTPREVEVLTWVSQGKTNGEIAAILNSRPRTVGKHLERIFVKLGVETRTAAAAMVGLPMEPRPPQPARTR